MTNFIQDGKVIDWAVPTDFGAGLTPGQAVLVGDILVIVKGGATAAEVLDGVTLAVCVEGVFELAKATGAAIDFGDLVYWDDTAKKITATATNNTKCGYCVEDTASGDTLIKVKLAQLV